MKNLNLNKEQIIQELQDQGFFKLDDLSIKIQYDDSPTSPRNWGILGKMICFHKRYDLGDKHNFSDYLEFEEFAAKNKSKLIILPLYLYDHSGLTMATTPFHCPWDSGQIGYIYAEKNQENLSEEQIKEALINEIAIYDQYLRGEVLFFEVLKDNKTIHAVFGYYQKEDCINEAISSFENFFKKTEPVQLRLF
jgi:hypothetical protein